MFGSGCHPNMKVFLNYYCQEARSLEFEGFQWETQNDVKVHSKVALIQSILDSVALPDVQRRQHVNSYDSCRYCYHPVVLVDLTKDEIVEEQANIAIAENV